jgi:hypothetical protein
MCYIQYILERGRLRLRMLAGTSNCEPFHSFGHNFPTLPNLWDMVE